MSENAGSMQALRQQVAGCPSGDRLAAALETASLANSDIPALICSVIGEKLAVTAPSTGGAESGAAATKGGAAVVATSPAAAVPATVAAAAPAERVSLADALCVIDGLMFLSPRCERRLCCCCLDRPLCARCVAVGPVWEGGCLSICVTPRYAALLCCFSHATLPTLPVSQRCPQGQAAAGAVWRPPGSEDFEGRPQRALGCHQACGGEWAMGRGSGRCLGGEKVRAWPGDVWASHQVLTWRWGRARLAAARPARVSAVILESGPLKPTLYFLLVLLQIMDCIPGDTKGKVLLYLHIDR